MVKFECKSLGLDCPYIATGNTVEDVKKDVQAHAQKAHKDLLAKMTPQQVNELYETVARMTH